MLRSHNYPDFYKACMLAASMVGMAKAADATDAVGN